MIKHILFIEDENKSRLFNILRKKDKELMLLSEDLILPVKE